MKTKKKITLPERIEKVYEPEVIPDKLDEFIEKSTIRQQEQEAADKRHKENLKQKRILATKEDKFIHAINLIIERAEYQNSPSICIDLKELNFENTIDDVKTLMGWFERLKAYGGFKHYSRQNYTGSVRFYISGISIDDLKSYQEKTKEAEKDDDAKEPPTTKIEITKIPELQIEGLKEIAKAKKRDDKPKFPYKLPAGTRWEEMTIKFLDNENVYIQIKQFKYNTNYKDMGFVGKGNNPNPSEAWVFLKVLAMRGGELTVKDSEARDKYKKQKELLAKSLQSYFSIDYDPFYPYRSSSEKSGNSYKIKITLIPPPDTEEKTDTDKDDNDDLGIKEYLDEQNQQVYEDE